MLNMFNAKKFWHKPAYKKVCYSAWKAATVQAEQTFPSLPCDNIYPDVREFIKSAKWDEQHRITRGKLVEYRETIDTTW